MNLTHSNKLRVLVQELDGFVDVVFQQFSNPASGRLN